MAIAITGATGFLGLRLLPLLLRRDEPIVVLARSAATSAATRILRYLAASGVPAEALRAARTRMTVLTADVRQARLGLPEWQFRALAGQLTEIWHSAAAITLDGDPVPQPHRSPRGPLAASARLTRETNLEGTHHVLDLATAGDAAYHHISTAFVAGRRPDGTVLEDELDGSFGFENPYEESKFLAERAVREWSDQHGRPATVFRPSVLVTDAPPGACDALHPLAMVGRLADYVGIAAGTTGRPSADRPLIRIPWDPRGQLNLMPAELAARLMVELAARPAEAGVRTAHISYPHEVTWSTLMTLFEQCYRVRFERVAVTPKTPTQLEALVSSHMRAVIPYAFYRRHYDRAVLRDAGLDPAEAPPLGPDYLLAALGRPTPALKRG